MLIITNWLYNYQYLISLTLLILFLRLAFPVNCNAAEADSLEIYGKLKLSTVNTDDSFNAQWNVNSNSSRIGIKGETEVGNDLLVFYEIEAGLRADGSDKKDLFYQRETILGLKGDLGSLWVAGNHLSPVAMTQSKVDLFITLEGDVKYIFEGKNRISNAIFYRTPKFKGISSTMAIVAGEGSDVSGNGHDDMGLADGVSYSISYNSNDFYIALAGDRHIDNQTLSRLVASVKLDAWRFGAMYQRNHNDTGDTQIEESGTLFSILYNIGKVDLKIQYGLVEDESNFNREDTLSLGSDYKFTRNTKTFLFYTEVSESKSLGLGIEHRF